MVVQDKRTYERQTRLLMPVCAKVEYSRLGLLLQRLKWWSGACSMNSPSMPICGLWSELSSH